MQSSPLRVIARIHTPHQQKFGIPRQSGMVEGLPSTIRFEPPYRDPNALRGLEGFSHIWVIWQFSESVSESWSPTVRPPRLGGNRRIGVFATRSPFRPNALGLSSLKLERIEWNETEGPILHVSGADLLDQTPIYDIKPYITFTDSHPDAVCGFTRDYQDYRLDVVIPPAIANKLPPEWRQPITDLLACDPRPSYQQDPTRVYGMTVADFEIRFTVTENLLTVVSIDRRV